MHYSSSFKFHVKFHTIDSKILTSIWTEKEKKITQVLLIWTKNNKVHGEGGGRPAMSPAFLLEPAGGTVVGETAGAPPWGGDGRVWAVYNLL
jgi:hypothetical protein